MSYNTYNSNRYDRPTEYENENSNAYTPAESSPLQNDNGEYEIYHGESIHQPKKQSNKKLITCIVVLSILLFLGCGSFIAYYLVTRSDEHINPVSTIKYELNSTTTVPTVATKRRTVTKSTPPDVPQVSPWSPWSTCSADCSPTLDSRYLECPTRKRSRNINGQTSYEKEDCNCRQCSFQYGQWEFRECAGDSGCHRQTSRYCQMVNSDQVVLRDSKTDLVTNRKFYKCSGWMETREEKWSGQCHDNCPTVCKWGGKILGHIAGTCPR